MWRSGNRLLFMIPYSGFTLTSSGFNPGPNSISDQVYSDLRLDSDRSASILSKINGCKRIEIQGLCIILLGFSWIATWGTKRNDHEIY